MACREPAEGVRERKTPLLHQAKLRVIWWRELRANLDAGNAADHCNHAEQFPEVAQFGFRLLGWSLSAWNPAGIGIGALLFGWVKGCCVAEMSEVEVCKQQPALCIKEWDIEGWIAL